MDIDVLALAKSIYEAVTGGNWALVAALAVVAIVFVLRKFVAPKVPFLASDAGGVLLAFFASLGGALSTAFAAGQPFTWALMLSAAKVAFLAMGAYAGLKKLFARPLAWLMEKLSPQAAS